MLSVSYPKEIYRILKPDGIFITEQVGALNDRDLVEQFYAVPPAPPFPRQHLKLFTCEFQENNFSILDSCETFGTIRFWDVSALIWFARVIEWEFPNFSVKNNLKQLFNIQKQLEKDGIIKGKTHRFLLIAKKK